MTFDPTRLRGWLAVPLVLAAACTDSLPSAPEAPAPVSLQRVECSADRVAGTVSCSAPGGIGAAGDRRGLVLGGQGTNVRLTSFFPAYASGSFTFYLVVQNLLGQAIGTTNGTTAASTGVRVFFPEPPTVTSGSGTVTVVGDGTDTFTGTGQPYYQYSQMLAPGATSGARQWRLDMPATVSTFSFVLYVSAPVRYPDGWVDLGATPLTVTQGSSTPLAAVVRDRLGRAQPGAAVSFASSNPAVATVDPATGVVAALAAGTATITATSGALTGSLAVTVQSPVASITVTPQVINLVVGATQPLTVTTRDAQGNVVYRAVTYQTAAAGIATVSATGVVTGVALGTTTVTATVEGVSASVTVNVVGPGPSDLSGVVVGANHSCGLAPGGAAYCWGRGASGQLGNGTTHDRPTPFAVAGGHTFASLSAGGNRTCGLTAGGVAWCWGKHPQTRFDFSETPVGSAVPVALAGGLAFASLDVGAFHACGVTTAGAAYCWGLNDRHQLGIPASTPFSATPVAVSGGFTFTAVTVGDEHSCGIAAGGAARCWGYGALGSTPPVLNGTPLAVAGGHTFTRLVAGTDHVCGIATGGAVFCWGDGNQGQLGDSLSTDSYEAPVAVSGGLAFANLSAANSFTCGVTTGGAYYCWGAGGYRFGTGTRAGGSAVPIAIPQGFAFASLDVGGAAHGCGATADGRAYCWGENVYGAVGDGSLGINRAVVGVAQYVVGGAAIRAPR